MTKLIKYILLLIIISVLVGAFFYWQGINQPLASGGEDVTFEIAPGEGVERIAANLEEAGLIKSSFYFKFYIWRIKAQSKLQAGEYLISPRLSIKEIVDSFIRGESLSRERTIKIIEGWTIDDIAGYFIKQGLDGENFSKLAKSYISAWPFELERPQFFEQAPTQVDFEGYLFPDTYRIFRDASIEDIIKKMFGNLDSKLTPELREEIERQGKTIHEIITMASIVEREVLEDDERPIVAGLLYKRLTIGMKLEVDASINYITGKNNPQSTYEDLQIDSPYNTYKYYGLPPGPISNPGLASIKAAIFPEPSEYLFYLNRLDTRETIFSKTHEEHVVNKNKYLR